MFSRATSFFRSISPSSRKLKFSFAHLPSYFQVNFRSASAMASQHALEVFEHKDIIRSAGDKRVYRAMTMKNGIKVVLVSDPDTDKSSAALDVGVGFMKDPENLPGLAHFCEHMLFLGTKKYEEENAYNKFLSEHGGMSNAYTSSENTNYFFDVRPENLSGALDRFAQFFLCPLFTPSATDREVNAVNSENDKNLQQDPWRFNMLDRSLGDPSHDFTKYGTGNKDTLDTIPKSLGLNTRDELLKFHSKYYSSNIMSLAVLGKESLDDLSEMVAPLFHPVENKSVEVPHWSEGPYGPEHVKKIFYGVPVKDLRNLSVSWTIPDLSDYYASNPGHILGHLIGHEGKGSLLSELKQKGWVNSLCGGQTDGANGFMFFRIDFDLSEEGLEHVDDILLNMFQYIEMLRKTGPQEWVFKECQQLSDMIFKFKDKEMPINYTSFLARRMQKYPLPEILSGSYLLTEYRPDLITMVLDKLVPETMRIGVISKKYADIVDQKEKWYGTDYKVEDIADEKIQKWKNCGLSENLHLPPRNEFIPTNFELVPREKDCSPLPEMIKETGLTRLWFKQDDKFLLPKACLSFEISSPVAYTDPTNCNMTSLFTELFKDALNEYSYDAELAGLSYDLMSTICGMVLQMKGYHEKQPVLLRKILEKLTEFKVDPKRFEIHKEMYMRGLRNFHAEEPYQHSVYYTNNLMSEVQWTKTELLEAAADITAEKLQAFIPELLSKLFIEALVYGNVTKQQAKEITDMMENILSEKCGTRELLPSQYKRYREVQIPDGCYYMYQTDNKVHKSSSIAIYYQCGMQDTLPNMLLELLVQIVGEPCFNILRTKEQLGYIVFSGVRRARGVQGLRVIIQSDRPPQYVDDRVEAFLHHMDTTIQEMGEEEYEKHVNALVTKRMDKPKKINGQNMKYWSEILSNTYNFDRDDIEVACLKTIKKDDLIKFFQDYIAVNAPQRHKLSIHILPATEELSADVSKSTENGVDLLPVPPNLPQPCVVEDVADFKRHLGLYPLPKPYIDIRRAKSKL
ncbi:insulin-degrading enzyme-like [Ostrea edulis]|uniref:insulin-degrading enzyme-like n=1 Tax=Ostrea edulis TaxID=37623 RepID=UPI0024AF1504|nr:insulin-degrading enzyme-like [Ostrea edulis]